MAADPLLGEVGWSWLSEALDALTEDPAMIWMLIALLTTSAPLINQCN
jgi:hypothetical protein